MNDFISDPPGRRPQSRVSTQVARSLRKNMPPQEVRVWARLRKLRSQGLHFRRQVPIGSHIVDFACLRRRLVVELDGSQHGEDDHAQRDFERDLQLQAVGFRVLRFWNSSVREDLDSVVTTIIARALEFEPEPSAHISD